MTNKKKAIGLLIGIAVAGFALVLAAFTSPTNFGAKGALFSAAPIFQLLLILLAFLFLLTIPLIVIAMLARRKELDASIEEIDKKSKQLLNQPQSGTATASKKDDTPEEGQEPRFFMLNEIDQKMQGGDREIYEKDIDLEELCNQFRNFAASQLKLYYSIEDIRRFISNLASTHVLIMQGMSGTGKTSLAYAFGEFIKNPSAIVPIQPMWKERSDLLGYYNEFTQRFNETVLLQKMYEANYKEALYVVILDEMNIARVEYYFAEFLSLLEIPRADRRYIDVVSDVWESDPKLLKNGQLKLPTNMWFIGTANNDDSTFAISDKVYDRAMVMNLDQKAEVFEAEPTQGVRLSAAYFDQLAAKARKEYRLTYRNRRRLRMLDEYMVEKFKITFGNRIMKQIESYVPTYLACGGDELGALDDIIAKKVFRKLETQNPIYVRNQVEGLCNFLDDLFGYDKMILCKSYLAKFERSA